MSYKNREVQPELFTKINKKHKQNLLNKNIFCSHYKSAISVSLDTLIVIIIGALMVNLSAFVIGMERGKVLARVSQDKNLAVPAGNAAVPVKQKKKVRVTVPEPKPQQTVEEAPEQPAQVVNNVGNPAAGYIIQLVTYSSNSYADKEVSRLKSLGLDGHVLKSGEYYIVYAGTFNTKTKADENIASFRKRYKDCFVRLLKNS